jgi:hypothetical protein
MSPIVLMATKSIRVLTAMISRTALTAIKFIRVLMVIMSRTALTAERYIPALTGTMSRTGLKSRIKNYSMTVIFPWLLQTSRLRLPICLSIQYPQYLKGIFFMCFTTIPSSPSR